MEREGKQPERDLEQRWRRFGKRNLWTMSAAAGLNDTGEEMMRPYLPIFFMSILGGSPVLFGLLMSVEEAANRIFKFFSGVVADRVGRKPPMVGGYLCIVGYRLSCALSRAWYHLVPPVTLRQVGRALRDPAREAMIAESVPERKRGKAFGLLQMMDTAGAVAGPVIGLLLLSFFASGRFDLNARVTTLNAYLLLFLVAAIPTCFSALLTYAFLKDTFGLDAAPRKEGFGATLRRGLKLFAGNRQLMVYTAANCVLAVGALPVLMLLAYAQASPDSAGGSGLGASIADTALLSVLYSLSLFALSIPAGQVVDRWGRKTAQMIGDALCILCLVAAALARNPLQMALPFVLFGAFEAFWTMSRRAAITDLAPKEARAQALGTFSMFYGMAAFLSPLMFGIVWGIAGALPAFVLMTSIVAASALFLGVAGKESLSRTAS